MKFELPAQIQSPEDVEAAIMDLRDYADLQHRRATQEKVTGNASAAEVTEVEARVVQLWGDFLPAEKVDEISKQLEEVKKSAPVVHLTLAAMPGLGLRKQLVEWFRKEIHPQSLVHFSFNANLLGGMVIRAGSHIFDYSFRRQVLEGRDRIPELLSKLAPQEAAVS